MSKTYWDVKFKHIIEREVTCVVEATSKEEAIQKAKSGDWVDNDEDCAPEDGIETKDYKCLGESEYVNPDDEEE